MKFQAENNLHFHRGYDLTLHSSQLRSSSDVSQVNISYQFSTQAFSVVSVQVHLTQPPLVTTSGHYISLWDADLLLCLISLTVVNQHEILENT